MVLQKYLAERLDLDGCDPLTPEAMAGPEPDHNESVAKSVSVLEMGLLDRRKLLGAGPSRRALRELSAVRASVGKTPRPVRWNNPESFWPHSLGAISQVRKLVITRHRQKL